MAEPPRTLLTGVPGLGQTPGDMIRLGITYLDPDDGAWVDPDTVRFMYLEPESRTPVVWTYDDDEELVRVSPGVYRVDLTLSEVGVWHARWETTGDYISAEEFSIQVADSPFV